MNQLKNERGAALVVVLGIIMLLMIFATVLAGQMTNTQKQINLTDREIDARNMARMGLDRVGKKVKEAYKAYEEEIQRNNARPDKEKRSEEEIRQDFFEDIETIKPVKIQLDNSHSYEIISASKPSPSITNPNMWVVKLTSIGHAFDKSIKEISKIEIENLTSVQ